MLEDQEVEIGIGDVVHLRSTKGDEHPWTVTRIHRQTREGQLVVILRDGGPQSGIDGKTVDISALRLVDEGEEG